MGTLVESLPKTPSSSALGYRDALSIWEMGAGQELEPALRSGAIALVDSMWLIDFAFSRHEKPLPCRQQLPQEAFLSLEDLKASAGPSSDLHIIALGYMWLHPRHPDPKGTTLRLVANACMEKLQRVYTHSFGLPRYGVFWDYACLFQSDPGNSVFRSAYEERLFQQGLQSLANFFSHPGVQCFKVTEFPDGYPEEYDLPPGANCAPYHERGWPFVENCWMSLKTSVGSRVQNLCQKTRSEGDEEIRTETTINQEPPSIPDRVRGKLQQVCFTNAKDDRPLVLQLYTTKFVNHFRSLTFMDFHSARWGDQDIALVSEIIQFGFTPCLTGINLSSNSFGLEGCRHLAMALSSPLAPSGMLRSINLSFSPIGDAGVQVLAQALVQIPEVGLVACDLGMESCRALAQAAQHCGLETTQMTVLRIQRNREIDEMGEEALFSCLGPLGADFFSLEVHHSSYAMRVAHDGLYGLID